MRLSPLLVGLCLSLLCVCLYVPGLGNPPFSTKGEAREATVAWEVWHSGEWVLPLRNGQIIASKPPLFHWLGALMSVAWGEMNELTIRLPSALLGIAGILLTYTTGTALWGVEAGVIAAVILATSFKWMQAATVARVDMTLTGCMLAALFLFLCVYRHRTVSRAQALLFFALLGLATLAKGPVGAVLPGLIIGVFLLVRRDMQFLRQMHIFSGATLCIGIVAAWYSLALWQGGEEFWSKVMTENVDRFVSGVAHKHPFYFFVPKLFLGMAPWSIFFPPLALYLYQRRRTWAEDGFLYFLVWVGTVFLFYSASSGKRSVYILPLYPALALLLGAWWSELIRGTHAFPKHAVWLVRGGGYVSLLLGGLGVGIVFAQYLGFDVIGLVRPLFQNKNPFLFPLAADSIAAHPKAFMGWFGVVGPAVGLLAWSIWHQRWRGVFGSRE